MSESIRSFIAVEFEDEIKDTLKTIIHDLKTENDGIKWAGSDNTHITLKFLGNVFPETIEKIKIILKGIVRPIHPFSIRLTDLGVFPNNRHPRIIWVGIDDQNNMKPIVRSLEERFNALGFAKENRDFKPHITIGRVKSNKNSKKIMEKLQSYSLSQDVIQSVTRITLFKSTLTSAGAIHEIIESFKFRNE